NLPLSLVLGTGLVIGLYLLANVAYLAALPVQGNPKLIAEAAAFDRRAAELDRAGRTEEARAVRKERDERVRPFDLGIAHARDDRVGTAVLEQASPNFGVPLMAVAVMVSTFGCVNALVLSGARLYYAMARDRLFFHSVGRLNANHVPAF